MFNKIAFGLVVLVGFGVSLVAASVGFDVPAWVVVAGATVAGFVAG